MFDNQDNLVSDNFFLLINSCCAIEEALSLHASLNCEFYYAFFRFRRKKSSNDWLLASAKAMEIDVDEDLYPLVKESATSLCFQKKG